MESFARGISLLFLAVIFFVDASAQRVFKDCLDCPEMVVIPAGNFMMGSDSFYSKDESPPHKVQIQSFAIGKYEVTQQQWFAVMERNPNTDKGPTLPVAQLSWEEAKQFIAKLNQKTGQKYRLPSEAEWEYAARAGTTTEWSHGNDESKLSGYAWYKENSGGRIHKVGQKLPNPFGLFDMHGNVAEFTQDCYSFWGYRGAPTDGSARLADDCGPLGDAVVRGGNWDSDSSQYLRSANRLGFNKFQSNIRIGFRLARDL